MAVDVNHSLSLPDVKPCLPASSGVLLLSTPFGVCAWATEPLSRPQVQWCSALVHASKALFEVLALYERPQLIVAALLDRPCFCAKMRLHPPAFDLHILTVRILKRV